MYIHILHSIFYFIILIQLNPPPVPFFDQFMIINSQFFEKFKFLTSQKTRTTFAVICGDSE